MRKKHSSQKGFAVLEGLLILVIITMLAGVGIYVYRAQKKTNDTLNNANQVSKNTPAVKGQKKTSTKTLATQPNSSSNAIQNYLVIKEWGVRAKYSGSLTLEYKMRDASNQRYADFTSKELLAEDPACTPEFGGLIARYLASDQADQQQAGPYSMTVGQYVANDKNKDYAYVGSYYYFFGHSEAGCGSDPDKTNALAQQTNDAVKGLLPQLEAVPAQ